MRLQLPNGNLDYDLDPFWDVAEPLNSKVQQILANIETDEADMFGYRETAEQLVGVALAAAQVYIVAVSRYQGIPKARTLDLGPSHSSGHSVARLIQHGANYWKHADEWNWEALPDQARKIVRSFQDLEMQDDDISLLRLVSCLTGSPTADMRSLQPLLQEWRTAVERAFPDSVDGAT